MPRGRRHYGPIFEVFRHRQRMIDIEKVHRILTHIQFGTGMGELETLCKIERASANQNMQSLIIFATKIHFSRRVSLKTAALFSFLSSRQSQQFSVSKITGISRAFFLFVCFPKEQVESCLLMKLVVL